MSLPPSGEIPQQLVAATAAWTKLRRLAVYAAFDGWTLAIVGTLTLVSGGYDSAAGLLVSIGLIGAGSFEIRTVRKLRRLYPGSISQLGYNQLLLAAIVILYSLISITQSHKTGGLASDIQQAISQAGGSTDDLDNQLSSATDIFYAVLIALTLLMQGGTALYYFSRRTHLRQYLQLTPDWIQRMQRERGEVLL